MGVSCLGVFGCICGFKSDRERSKLEELTDHWESNKIKSTGVERCGKKEIRKTEKVQNLSL